MRVTRCAYCDAEVEEVEENHFIFRSQGYWQGCYVCESCRRRYMVTDEQAEEVLDKWKDGARG